MASDAADATVAHGDVHAEGHGRDQGDAEARRAPAGERHPAIGHACRDERGGESQRLARLVALESAGERKKQKKTHEHGRE